MSRAKIFLVFLLMMGLFVITGCAHLELHYDISDQGIEIRNLVRLETDTPEGRALLDELLNYWQEEGYIIHPGINEKEAGARKLITTKGRRQTAIYLRQYFSGRQSPFSHAEFDYKRGFWADKFSFDLVLDLSQPVVEPESLAGLPPMDAKLVQNLVDQDETSLVVSITLPGRVTSANGSISLVDGRSTVLWPLRLGEKNQLQLAAVIINPLPVLLTGIGGILVLSQFMLMLTLGRRRRKAPSI